MRVETNWSDGEGRVDLPTVLIHSGIYVCLCGIVGELFQGQAANQAFSETSVWGCACLHHRDFTVARARATRILAGERANFAFPSPNSMH